MKRVDVLALSAALDIRRVALGLSWRQVAGQADLSASTFTRMRAGCGPDLDGYAACCEWLGAPMDAFRTAPAPQALVPGGLRMDILAALTQHRVPQVYWRPLTELICQ